MPSPEDSERFGTRRSEESNKDDANDSATLSEVAITEGEGSVIGRYKLLQFIGEGGFGEVWSAKKKPKAEERPARSQ